MFGFMVIVTAGAVQSALFPEMWELDWRVWFAAITMPLFAFLLGFFGGWIFCLDRPQRTAIGFEISLQNVSLAITIVTVAFPNAETASYYSQYIILYGTFQIVLGVGLVILHNSFFRYRSKTTICHQIVRWRNRKKETQRPDLQTVTANGTTLQSGQSSDIPKSESIINMAYTGSSLSLTHLDSDKTGSGFVPDHQVGSSTQLVRLDSVDSTIDLLPNSSTPSSPNGFISFSVSETSHADEHRGHDSAEKDSNGIEIYIEGNGEDKN